METVKKILITGATGNLGSNTINFLLEKGFAAQDIYALVRNEEKAAGIAAKGVNIIIGNYNDFDGLVKAFKGVEKLLFISSNDGEKRNQHHDNVVKAAKESAIKHIIYTSLIRKTEDGSSGISMISLPTIETEQKIKDAGLEYTILKNGLYAEVLPSFLGKDVMKNGIIFPAENGKANFTLVSDLAEALAIIICGEGHEKKEYVLTNEISYSFQDIANILSDFNNNEIKYFSPGTTEYVEILEQSGLPSEYIGFFMAFAKAIGQGEFETLQTDLTKLLGRKPKSLNDFLRPIYSRQ